MVTGGPAMDAAIREVVQAFSQGPHIFNLGHGITPEANPANVARMIEVVRAG
jgi:uroporphyrinogen decarboxylase